NWKEAGDALKKAVRIAQDAKAGGKLTDWAEKIGRTAQFVEAVEKGTRLMKEGAKDEAMASFKTAQKLRPNHPLVVKMLSELGYNPQQFTENLNAAIKALIEPWKSKYVTEAVAALRKARQADPNQPRLPVLERFAEDLKKC